MDKAWYRVLSFLNESSSNELIDLTPLLSELFQEGQISTHVATILRTEGVRNLLGDMWEKQVITTNDYKLANRLDNDTKKIIDPTPAKAKITVKGEEFLERENNRILNLKIAQSNLDTGQSVIDTNLLTKRSLEFQKKTQVITLLIAAVSTVFIVLQVWIAWKDESADNLIKIRDEIAIQRKKLDSMNKSLQDINRTIERKILDTLNTYKK